MSECNLTVFSRCDNLFPYDEEEKCFKTADGMPIRTMYVSNLSNYTKKKELFDFCSKVGPVEKASIIKKRSIFPGHLYGFVTYSNPQDAAKAIDGASKIFIRGRLLKFSPADSWHQQPKEKQNVCPISMLNDDCLRLIFDLFHIEERLVLGSVCKRWHLLNNLYWKSITELDFYNPPLSLVNFDDTTLEQILQHCSNLQKLKLKRLSLSSKSSILVTIGTNCKKLQELSLLGIQIHKRCLAFLAGSCPNLRLLHFLSVYDLSDHELSLFLKKSKNLESLKVGIDKTNHRWMNYLKPPMTSLHISTDNCDNHNFYSGLSKIKKTLKSLSVEHCKSFSYTQLKFIAENFNLDGLSLRGSLELCSTEQKMDITKLKNLLSLDLSYSEVIEREFMSKLAQNCVDISILDLKGVDEMECGGRSLEEFVSLRILNLTRSHFLTDDVVIALSKKLKKLEAIQLNNCQNISDEGVIAIVQNCPEIKNIEVASCGQVTNRTILAALDVLLNEKRRRTISMRVLGTKILEDDWNYDPSFKKFINLDFSCPSCNSVDNDEFHEDFPSDDSLEDSEID